jgi:triacylglycerol lipase
LPVSRTIAALAVSCSVILAAASASAGNTDPIVLVHGFLGWGLDELVGLKYWSRPQPDVVEDLGKQGHNVQVAVVGPLSSNWDRAVELFAQLTGGCADYGGPDHR